MGIAPPTCIGVLMHSVKCIGIIYKVCIAMHTCTIKTTLKFNLVATSLKFHCFKFFSNVQLFCELESTAYCIWGPG